LKRKFCWGLGALVVLVGIATQVCRMLGRDSHLWTPSIIWQTPQSEYGLQVAFTSTREMAVLSWRIDGKSDRQFVLRLVDLSGTVLRTFDLGAPGIYNMVGASSPNSLIAMDFWRLGGKQAAVIMDVRSGTRVDIADHMFPPGAYGDSQPFSPSGKMAIVLPAPRGQGMPQLVESASGRKIRDLKLPTWHGPLLRWKRDGTGILALDPATGRLITQGLEPPERGGPLCFPRWKERAVLSPDARRVAVFNTRRMGKLVVWVYDTATGKRTFAATRRIPSNQRIENVQWSPRGDKLLVTLWQENREDWGPAPELCIINMLGKLQTMRLAGWRPIGLVEASSWSTDGRWLAVALLPPSGDYRPVALAVLDTKQKCKFRVTGDWRHHPTALPIRG